MGWATVIATIAGAVSAIAAAMGLVFAGRQLRITHKDREEDHRVAREGVAVSWQPVLAPAREESDGTACWKYEIAVHNPGRLPIQDIEVRITFPCEVIRVHYDKSTDPPTRTLTMNHPVLAGGERRAWNRVLRIQFDQRHSLTNTYATVGFRDVEGNSSTNRWPRWPTNEPTRHNT